MEVPISVVIPCFNQGQYLSEAIDSVVKQSFDNWQCIIVDDGSTDNTEEVALKWCNKDHRIHFVKKENGGVSSARNAGIEKATGEFILPLDADDKIHRDYLKNALDIFASRPDITLVYADAELFDSKTCFWDLPDYNYRSLLIRNLIYCSAIYRKSDWKDVGCYDENLLQGCEDWEFWIRLLHGGKKIYKIPEVRFYYRQTENSMLQLLIGNEKTTQQKEHYIFNKHQSKYEKEFGSMINNLNKIVKLNSENETLKKSFAFKLSYPIIKLVNKMR